MHYQMMPDGRESEPVASASGTQALWLRWNERRPQIEGRQMKIHSATSAATGNRNQVLFVLPRKENVLLAAGVALAFIFVTACIFTLG